MLDFTHLTPSHVLLHALYCRGFHAFELKIKGILSITYPFIIYFLAGTNAKWSRSSCEEAVYEFKAGTKRIHQRGEIIIESSAQEPGHVAGMLC